MCGTLESRGIRCWIAPRDILPGADWVESIVDALEESRIFVLVLSADSNTSPQVIREVGRAASRDVPIIPLRIDNALPSKAMDFYISSHQWLDAYTRPLEKHLQQLADTVQTLLTRRYGVGSQPVSVEETRPEEQAGKVTEAVVEKEEREVEEVAKAKTVSVEKPVQTGKKIARPFLLLIGRAEGQKYRWLPRALTTAVVLGVVVAAGVLFLPGLWSDKESTDGDGGSLGLTYQLEVIVDPPGGGSVSPESTSYGDGDSVTLTATPSQNYRFNYWSGDAEGAGQSTKITMDSDKTVVAHFVEIIYYQLTVSVDPSGGGSVSPESASYSDGDSVTLTATPSQNYSFDYWSGDAEGTANKIEITMDSHKRVVAHFTLGPQYGGTYTQALTANISYFDEVAGGNYGGHVYATTTKLTNNELLQGDWTKGPAGTNETDWINAGDNRLDQKAGCLADTWEIPKLGTIVFHIREGVYWQDKEPVNGRELTVDDIVYSLNRALSAGYFKMFYPTMCATMEITADEDARTVTVTVPADQWVNCITVIPDYTSIVPREAIETWGDQTAWEHSLGTGPFLLTDWVDNSQATFERNPDYWETNPLGPGEGDQLPYIDEVRWVIMTDPSSVVAAFETGDLDSVSALNYNTAQPLLDDPDLAEAGVEWQMYQPDGCYAMFFRTDMADSPFSVKEVRQAMSLAIDNAAIRDNYYQGYAEIMSWPIVPTPAYMDACCTLEELPENVQALYGRDVEAAQALLDQTAYSEGFDCSVVCWDGPTIIDVLSLVQGYLDDIGINMELDVIEYSVYSSVSRARNYGAYEIMYTTDSGNGTYLKMLNFSGASAYNPSYVNDPRGSDPTIEAAYQAIIKWAGIDEAKMMQIHKELMPYLLEQCYCIPMPSAKYFALWWPWVKNFYGAISPGYYNAGGSLKYRWIDQDLKESMGY